MSTDQQKPAQQNTDEVPDDIWLVRPCEVYREEYQDCKRILSRVYQHYMYGAQTDCSQWLTDYNNCMLFRKQKDLQAAEALIAVEKDRRKERLQLARANDIWEYRTSPPAEWSKPLEELRQEKQPSNEEFS